MEFTEDDIQTAMDWLTIGLVILVVASMMAAIGGVINNNINL